MLLPSEIDFSPEEVEITEETSEINNSCDEDGWNLFSNCSLPKVNK